MNVVMASRSPPIENCQRILSTGACMKEVDCQGKTMLHTAAEDGRLGVVHVLVGARADLETVAQDGTTPLLAAADAGHIEVANCLIGAGAKAEALTQRLLEACEQGQWQDAECLLLCGACCEARAGDASTPLLFSAEEGHVPLAETLLARSADLEARRTPSLRTPLMVAVAGRHVSMVRLLVDHGADREAKDFDGHTPFTLAVAEGDTKLCGALAGGEESASGKAILGKKVLQACLKKQWEAVDLFLRCNASTEEKSKDGRTSLLIAVEKGHQNTALLLLDHCADAVARSHDGRGALAIAAQKSNIDMAQLLLERGVSHEDREDVGHMLTDACLRASWTKAMVLIECGSSLDVESEDGCTPLAMAVQAGQEHLTRALIDRGVRLSSACRTKFGTKLLGAAEKGDASLVGVLLLAKVNYEKKDSAGERPLHKAATQGHMEVVKVLLDCRAEIDARSSGERGRSPLFLAAKLGHLELARLLADRGAKDPEGAKALRMQEKDKKPHARAPRARQEAAAKATEDASKFGQMTPKPKLTKASARALLTAALDRAREKENRRRLVETMESCGDGFEGGEAALKKMMMLMPLVESMMGPVLRQYGFEPGDLITVTMEVQAFSKEDPSIADDCAMLMQAVQGDFRKLFR